MNSRALCVSALLTLAATMALPALGQTFATLHIFCANTACTDGEIPEGTLVQGTDGAYYGTTSSGGSGGSGTVFRITPGGALTTLYGFCAADGCTDGASPVAGLIQATDGDFYGTTYIGGAGGHGTVFKITSNGALTSLYSFCAQLLSGWCAHGEYPNGSLIQGTDGNFYGTTYEGGANGYGSIFSISPGGALKTLYSFCAAAHCTDGASPAPGLIQASDGNFYGTTADGGTGNGTIFRLTPDCRLKTLYTFCSGNCVNGATPSSGLIQAADGDLYGSTSFGGVNNAGTLFKITMDGKLTTLYSFCTQANCPDGHYPQALTQGTDGNFYGVTSAGGAQLYYGTVVRLTPAGVLTTLHSFCAEDACADGANPSGGLMQATNGDFYGTTHGNAEAGSVFRLSVGLGSFVRTQTTSGKVGAAVTILGTDLEGAASVTFNGTAAEFKVVSGTEITSTVPPSATTGTVEVSTPRGLLASAVPFRVL
jgi:uncharacterized repeat protein (TIGR03803 family)